MITKKEGATESLKKWEQDEIEELLYLANEAWSWEWPGWEWVAANLDSEFDGNRTPAACRSKVRRMEENEK